MVLIESNTKSSVDRPNSLKTMQYWSRKIGWVWVDRYVGERYYITTPTPSSSHPHPHAPNQIRTRSGSVKSALWNTSRYRTVWTLTSRIILLTYFLNLQNNISYMQCYRDYIGFSVLFCRQERFFQSWRWKFEFLLIILATIYESSSPISLNLRQLFPTADAPESHF
jgi:hypothetical protein